MELQQLWIQPGVCPVLPSRSAQPDQLLQGLLPAPLHHSPHLGLLPVILMVVRVSEDDGQFACSKSSSLCIVADCSSIFSLALASKKESNRLLTPG